MIPDCQKNPCSLMSGCLNSVVAMGGFAGGIYIGISESKGIDVSNLEDLLLYGPASVSAGFGFLSGLILGNDKSILNEIYINSPHGMEKEAIGCVQGCCPIGGSIISAGITGGLTYIGYLTGKWMGSKF